MRPHDGVSTKGAFTHVFDAQWRRPMTDFAKQSKIPFPPRQAGREWVEAIGSSRRGRLARTRLDRHPIFVLLYALPPEPSRVCATWLRAAIAIIPLSLSSVTRRKPRWIASVAPAEPLQ